MTVAIIDYGSGNLRSASKAFERAAHDAGLDIPIEVTGDAERVRRAERIVLPGVGAFADCRAGLKAVPGMWETLEEEVRGKAKPFLGICVGMQLMAERGLEYGSWDGFGWIPGEVRHIEPAAGLKVPHMGWNVLEPVRDHELTEGLTLGADGLHAYFVHSYHLVTQHRADLVAQTDYGGPVTAIVAQGNMAGTQFHPEKSQALGLRLITNFLSWRP